VHLDPASAECLVFTFREGLLSAVAHDLKIRVTRFAIEIGEREWGIEASFDPASLRVVCAVRDGVDVPGDLSDGDKRQIEQNILRDVLEAARYPEIRFASARAHADGSGLAIEGVLTLHGARREITVRARPEGGAYVAEARLHQPRFGIRPYSALLGTLRVRADVAVRVRVPLARLR